MLLVALMLIPHALGTYFLSVILSLVVDGQNSVCFISSTLGFEGKSNTLFSGGALMSMAFVQCSNLVRWILVSFAIFYEGDKSSLKILVLPILSLQWKLLLLHAYILFTFADILT